MSAEHEQAIMIRQSRGLTSLKNATLQAGTPAFQSVDESECPSLKFLEIS